MGKDPEGTENVEDAHEITESGFPKVSSIAYAKNILGVEPSATVEEVNEAYTNGYIIFGVNRDQIFKMNLGKP